MHNDRDVSMPGHYVFWTIYFGDQGSQKFVQGLIVSGRPISPPRPGGPGWENDTEYGLAGMG